MASLYVLVAVISVTLACLLVSFGTVLRTISVGGLLILVPTFLVKAKKLPECSSEKVRRFLEHAKHGPIAHRGGSPENTLAAISKSKREGASGVELDLAVTKDGHAVLLHDATVDRTSNGTGLIEEMTLEQAKSVEFVGERIPTLKEAVSLCMELDLLTFIEIKSTTVTDEAIRVITEIFSKTPEIYDRVAVVSFFPNMLYKLRSADPNIICGLNIVTGYLILTHDGVYEGKAWWKYLLSPLADYLMLWSIEAWLLTLLGVKLLLPNRNLVVRNQIDVKKLQGKGMYVIPWTVNDKKEMDHFKNVLNISFVTDFVSLDNANDQLDTIRS